MVALVALSRKSGKEQEDPNATRDGDAQDSLAKGAPSQIDASNQRELQVMFEEIAALSPAETQTMVEISDPRLIAQIDAAIPTAAKMAMDAAASGSLDRAIDAHNQALKNVGKVYQAIIPKGAELTNSKAMEGAKRGFFRGPDNIRGHANLVEAKIESVDPHIADPLKMANAMSTAMDIGSVVVGQYYMAQINNKLAKMETDINDIAEFQDMEYRSKVTALIASVQRSATFRLETMQSEELRKRELDSLRGLEHECAQLLGQANLTIQEKTKDRNIDYATYERLTDEIESWYDYQQILLRIMEEIAELNYTLSLGAMSRENSYAICDPYARQSAQAQQQLKAWHGDVTSRLEIDLPNARRRRRGLKKAAWAIPGLFNDDLNYSEIPAQTKKEIDRHIFGDLPESSSDPSREITNYYDQDIRIIKSGGKTYYLPATS